MATSEEHASKHKNTTQRTGCESFSDCRDVGFEQLLQTAQSGHRRQGVEAYDGSVKLIRQLRDPGFKIAVVTQSGHTMGHNPKRAGVEL